MISRTAENCFWLSRNIERVQMLTNAINVAYNVELEIYGDAEDIWYPLIVVLGCKDEFIKRYGYSAVSNAKKIQEFLIWDRENPFSIYSSLSSARENARIIRDLIAADMWEEINELWLWANSAETHRFSMINLDDFCKKIIKFCFLWIGFYHNFILRNDTYNFMKLGMLIERVDFTLRLGDIHHQRDISLASKNESMDESQYWQEMLLNTMSKDAFMRKADLDINRKDVAEFLLKSDDYPRTIAFCLNDCLAVLKRMSYDYHSTKIGMQSREKVEEIIKYIENNSTESLLEKNHEFITYIINSMAELTTIISKEFFISDVDFYVAMLEG
ncbi:alpha-E domain-containing protein [Francisella sp. LA112445]|nr:alpha-E domain-containing protein [Francisella sp. LA112445]